VQRCVNSGTIRFNHAAQASRGEGQDWLGSAVTQLVLHHRVEKVTGTWAVHWKKILRQRGIVFG
jgi:hypothetical protein